MSEINMAALNLPHQRKGDLIWYDGKQWSRVAAPDSAAAGKQALVWDASASQPVWDSPEDAGSIKLWNGAIVDIPTGWQLCDGTNGTPDFRNFFVVGAGDTYAVNATGGATSQTPSAHVGTAVADHPVHNHPIGSSSSSTYQSGGAATAVSLIGANTNNNSAAQTHSVTQPSNHSAIPTLPPYLAKAWIMKL